MLKSRTRNYTGFYGAESFDAFVEALNTDGALDAVDPRLADDDDEDAPDLRGRNRELGRNRALEPKEAIFFVLMRCISITPHILSVVLYSDSMSCGRSNLTMAETL